MSYPFYTLNFVKTNDPKVQEQLKDLPGGPVNQETFDAIAAIARQAIADGAVTVIKGSHTLAIGSRSGPATAYLSHNDELKDKEPTINIVIF